MKGFVPTPPELVDLMIGKLFRNGPPPEDSCILDPGCGTGAFISGIIRWCSARGLPIPNIVGVELDPEHAAATRARFSSIPTVEIRCEDFLDGRPEPYQYIVGNPPYVSITSLSEKEKRAYRTAYTAAIGRFDLYLLFFEQALKHLAPRGRLVFVTPEKYLYVQTAVPLRRILAEHDVEEIHLLPEDSFGSLVTYPAITSVSCGSPKLVTRVLMRNGDRKSVPLPVDGSSWLPHLHARTMMGIGPTLGEITTRVSCGVATGADSVYVFESDAIPAPLQPFMHPTISGKELITGKETLHYSQQILIPYDRSGRLLKPTDQGMDDVLEFLSMPLRRKQLMKRTCIVRKPWYAFHETPPIGDLLRPKILCKDITSTPNFWIDYEGKVIPRHSVYYIVPRDPGNIESIRAYLMSKQAKEWLMAHSQRAANGFIRLQSSILRRLPVPSSLRVPQEQSEVPVETSVS